MTLIDRELVLKNLDKQINWWSLFDDGETASSLMITLSQAKRYITETMPVIEQKHDIVYCQDCCNKIWNGCDGASWLTCQTVAFPNVVEVEKDFFCAYGKRFVKELEQ